ncbi:MAG: hypothetical protein QY310_03205 [Candidatus Jettenia sp. CY-1]|nr:hypothetical protein [Candidatus Jettenia sp.]WKZ19575.1 MAG: hypothetical protein QY310_03205 [Candidatus Jettenia sp. CY-1]
MERAIGVKDLQDLGLLGVEYTKLDLYDAFMMYLILNCETIKDHVVLRNGKYIFDSNSCFGMDNWMV